MSHHRRRILLFLGLMGLMGLTAALLAPRPDPVVGTWQGSTGRLTFYPDGRFRMASYGTLREGNWSALPGPVEGYKVSPLDFLVNGPPVEEWAPRIEAAHAYRVQLLVGPPEVNEEGILFFLDEAKLYYAVGGNNIAEADTELSRVPWWEAWIRRIGFAP